MAASQAPQARELLRGRIMALPVFDVHNHLRGGERLAAKDFWDIGHYFWFKRELEAAGYPRTPEDLPGPERAKAFIKALDRARNTAWNGAVRAAMKELFGVELVDEASILELNEKIAATHADPEWPKKVCRLAGLAALTIGSTDTSGYGSVSGLIRPAPSYNPVGRKELERVAGAADQKRAFDELLGKVRERLDEFEAAGIRAMRAPWLFEAGEGLVTDVPELAPTGNSPERLKHAMAHAFFRELDARRFHLQIFLGVEGPKPGYKPRTKAHRSRPVNDTSRIVAMHEIFDMYADCTFELINGAELSSLDIVQAARAYTNVYPGGLWWFTFRPSVYRANMQFRMEGLPACRSTFVATDARCIEWAYIKTMYVKRLMAEFLCGQVERGWLDEASALSTARWWLHDTGAELYAPERKAE